MWEKFRRRSAASYNATYPSGLRGAHERLNALFVGSNPTVANLIRGDKRKSMSQSCDSDNRSAVPWRENVPKPIVMVVSGERRNSDHRISAMLYVTPIV